MLLPCTCFIVEHHAYIVPDANRFASFSPPPPPPRSVTPHSLHPRASGTRLRLALRRETVIKRTRDIQKWSKLAIYSLHR